MYIKEKQEEKGSCVCGKRINKYKFLRGQKEMEINYLKSAIRNEGIRTVAQSKTCKMGCLKHHIVELEHVFFTRWCCLFPSRAIYVYKAISYDCPFSLLFIFTLAYGFLLVQTSIVLACMSCCPVQNRLTL